MLGKGRQLRTLRIIFTAFFVFAAACQTSGKSHGSAEIQPFHTPDVIRTVTATPASPTPRMAGDTLSEIPPVELTKHFTLLHQLGRGWVHNMSVSPSNDSLVVATTIGVWVYSLPEDEVILFQAGHPVIDIPYSYVADIKWSPDGSCLAVSQDRNGIWIWDATTWELLTEKEGGDSWRSAGGYPGFSWSPGGDQLALGTGGGNVWVWDKGTNVWEAKENKIDSDRDQLGMYWAKDGRLMTVVGHQLIDVDTGEIVGGVPHGIDGAGRIVWSPGGTHLYYLFDLGGGLVDLEEGHFFGCCTVFSWSQDGTYLAAFDLRNYMLYTVDTTNNELVFEQPRDEKITSLAWTQEDELLAGTYQDGDFIVFNVQTGAEVLNLGGLHSYFWLAMGPNEPLVVSRTNTMFTIWNFDKGTPGNSVAYSRDEIGNISLKKSNRYYYSFVDEYGSLHINRPDDFGNPFVIDGNYSWSGTTLFVQDKILLFVMNEGETGSIQVRDYYSGEKVFELQTGVDSVNFRVSPDNRRLIVLNDQGDVTERYDLDTFMKLEEMKSSIEQADLYDAYAHSLDGKYLAAYNPSVTYDIDHLRLWNKETGQELPSMDFQFRDLDKVLWSLDSKMLITLEDGTVLVWEFIDGEISDEPISEYSLEGTYLAESVLPLTSEATVIELSPDGETLAIGHGGGDIVLWDIKTGRILGMERTHEDWIGSLLWVENGASLYSSSRDGTVKKWGIRE